ncbi:GNAT family N-acetyltransferase [Acinetobacter sp. NCu2D-2]|uniref:GNAT family N-acetyltransferase n=1 Tax=Acinetobacter sp. NCu2D-2 TaxID=1608473 RepID=UPI0007CDD31F|nr:GNAT family N-acetyltransferase [Acinetobacter sp. NCu2D-2]ANF81595.1 GNAT family N-acetyltransferase [Acinetobacter sp. NCu2D-2]
MSILIRKLADVSYAEWLLLWQGYQAFYQTQLSDAVNTQTWQRLIDAQIQEMYGFAAIEDQRVVGIVHVIEHASCWTLTPYAYLQDLFTLKEYRGQGIATALIHHVEQYCKQQRNCDRVYWLTHQDNITARQLYDRVAARTGFIQYRI